MNKTKKRGIYERFVKRALDASLACILLFLCAPVLLICALAVRIFVGSPVLFRQKRGGKDGRVFEIYKFRTMTDKRDANGMLLPDSERVTGLGAFLRRTSLDELPQLFNILRGEMSFIGPRPQLADFLPYYTGEENLRHCVRPGLSGLAQVSGRNNIAWKKRFELDILYVEKISFALDMKIFFLTFGALGARGNESDSESFFDRK